MAHPSEPSHGSVSRTHLVDLWGTLGDSWVLLCDPWASLGDPLILETTHGKVSRAPDGDPFVSMGDSMGDPGTSLGESWAPGVIQGPQGWLMGLHGWTLGGFFGKGPEMALEGERVPCKALKRP